MVGKAGNSKFALHILYLGETVFKITPNETMTGVFLTAAGLLTE